MRQELNMKNERTFKRILSIFLLMFLCMVAMIAVFSDKVMADEGDEGVSIIINWDKTYEPQIDYLKVKITDTNNPETYRLVELTDEELNSDESSWTKTIPDLPNENENGIPIEYALNCIIPDEYGATTAEWVRGKKYQVDVRYKFPEGQYTSVSAKVEWNDENNVAGKRPPAVNMPIYSNE